MKRILFTLLIFVFAQNVFGQGINFQGVARSANGTIIASSNISLRLSIISKNVDATPEYIETKTVVTNAQGIFSIVVGDATNAVVTGNFKNIAWKDGIKFLKVEMDPSAGTNYINMGATQLQYVPYSFYSLGVDAANVTGVLPIEKGGTGVATLAGLKTALALDKVNNTADLDKPVSKETQAAIDLISTNFKSDKYSNVFVGQNAGLNYQDPNNFGYGTNTAIGSNSLQNNTDYWNVAVGGNSLSTGKWSRQNTAVGYNSMVNYKKGFDNVAIGYAALSSLDTGIYNTALGTQTLINLKNSNNNTALGYRAMAALKTGNHNLAVGYQAGYSLDSGFNNIFIGTNAGAADVFSKINNKLIISNSPTANPLIYGDFENRKLKFNANIDSLTILNRINFVDENANDHINKYDTGYSSPLIYSRYFYGHYGDLVIQGMSKTYTGNIHFVTGSNMTGYESPRQRMVIMDNGNVGIGDFVNSPPTSKLQVSGFVSATGYKIPGGTSAQYLRADGTVTTSVTAGVPYTGASQATNLGAYDLTVNGLTIGIGSGTVSASTNTAVGNRALLNNSNGENNVSMGYNSMYTNTTGSRNVGVGNNVLKLNTTGNQNVGLGFESLINNTTGSMNISVGGASMWGNTTGTGNAAIGNGSLLSNTTGSYNVALGYQPLWYNVLGSNNVAIGQSALFSNVNNSGTVAIGFQAMLNADNRTTGRTTGNTAVGYESLKGSSTAANNTGKNNTAVGYQSLLSNTSGSLNSAFGDFTLNSNTTGSENTAIGSSSLQKNTTGESNIAIGISALDQNTTGSYNTVIGSYSLLKNTTGLDNSALGFQSLYKNSTGSKNIAIGFDALYSNVGNVGSLAVGYRAMYYADDRTSGINTYNTAIGYEALKGGTTAANNTGTSNTTIGYQALSSNTSGGGNLAIGTTTMLANTTGERNTALGTNSLQQNISGSSNTSIGFQSLYKNSTASSNIAIGDQTMYNNLTGASNIAIGNSAGNTITSGSNNILVGHNADASNNLSNAIAIGGSASVTTSNTIQLGNTSITDVKTSGAITAKKYTSGVADAMNFSTGTNNVDLSLSNIFTINLSGNITLTFSNGTPGTYIIKFIQDGTGSRTVTFPVSNWKWAGGSAPTLTTNANKTDIVSIIYDGTTYYSTIVKGF